MTAQPVKVNLEKLASEVVGKDIVNSWGLFHVTSAEVLPSKKIKATCVVTSHRLCADNLVNGVQSMNARVFILTIAEAKVLAKKPTVKQYFQSQVINSFSKLEDGEIPF